jgi:hypothetical protein
MTWVSITTVESHWALGHQAIAPSPGEENEERRREPRRRKEELGYKTDNLNRKP